MSATPTSTTPPGLIPTRDPASAINWAMEEYSERSQTVGDTLATLREACGAELTCGTYGDSDQQPDLQALLRWPSFQSEGEVQFLPERVLLVTRGQDRHSRFSVGASPQASGWAVHVVLFVHNSVGDSFYMRAGEAAAMRFGRASTSLVGHNVQSLLDATVPHLYSLCADDQWLWIYVDGTLLWRKRRETAGSFESLTFELFGEGNADLEASVQGLEIWTLPAPFQGLYGDELAEAESRMLRQLQDGDTSTLCRMLRNLDGLSLEPHADLLYEQLWTLLSSAKGFREWEIEELLQFLPAAYRDRWSREAPPRYPQPLIDVSHIVIRFERNPLQRWAIQRLLKGDKATTLPVNDVSLRVYDGDIVGIIGRNGAGKSTLLKCLSGLLPIETGRVRVNGTFRLLKAGLGMRPELSGYDNILLAGIFMGLRRQQIRQVIDEVVEFTELGEAIDQPIRYYSDGMMSRLMFAVATSVPPQILMLDELLSAGDLQFRRKAEARMQSFIKQAAAVVVVTHDLNFVRTQCNKVGYMTGGRMVYWGDPEIAISLYLDEIHIRPDEARRFEETL